MRTVLAAVIVLAACHDTSTKPPVPPRAKPAAPASVRVDDPLALLPASSDVVIKVDVAGLRKSLLWSEYQQWVVDFFAPSFAGCGYNPLADLDTVMAGIPMGDELGVFVFRGLDRDKTLHCLKTSNLETNTSAIFDGDIVKLVNKSGNVNLITFLDEETMVMQGSTNPTRATLTAALAAGAPLRQNLAYLRLEREVPTGAAIAFVIPPGSSALNKLAAEKVGAPMREMYATIRVTDTVAIHGVITMQNAADATAISEASRDSLAAMKSYVQRYEVQAKDDQVRFELEATEAQIRMFVDMVKAMMPAGQ